MKIAIQGELGSFHHEAAILLEPSAKVVPQKSFAGVFQSVLNANVEFGLCAVENNIYGPISEVYRLLVQNDVWIVRDIRIHIFQQLIGCAPVSLNELSTAKDVHVLSQAPAFAQVEQWLDKHLPRATREEIGDTALSVQTVMVRRDIHTIAVAGNAAAAAYNAVILAKDIQDEPDNYTRFILFQKAHNTVPSATHASMLLRTDHTPGALLRALQVFSDNQCNLTKLDSHPIPSDQRHYMFFIDYKLSEQNVSASIIEGLRRQGCEVRLLGEYVSINE